MRFQSFIDAAKKKYHIIAVEEDGETIAYDSYIIPDDFSSRPLS